MMIASLALVITASQASFAEIQEPLWKCAMTFDIQGGGLKVLVGKFDLQGPGHVSCVDVLGNREEIPVYVTLGGAPLTLSAGVGQLEVFGMATGIGIAGTPSDLLGHYIVGGVRGSLFIGAGADMALHATHRSFTLNVSVQAVRGWGANIGFDHFIIERL